MSNSSLGLESYDYTNRLPSDTYPVGFKTTHLINDIQDWADSNPSINHLFANLDGNAYTIPDLPAGYSVKNYLVYQH